MTNKTALRAFRSLYTTVCTSCSHSQPLRPISQTTARKKTDHSIDSLLSNVGREFQQKSTDYYNIVPANSNTPYRNLAKPEWEEDDRHKLHIYSHKHNTHITLTKPNREALLSVSCGNIGFRKAGRATYDAAYQLAAFVMSRIQDKGLLPQIERLELVYRGFGPGREAVTKAILSTEGKRIRPLIMRLSDSTRLKFGGTRSPKPRRLG